MTEVVPYNQEAEWGIVSQMMSNPTRVAEVIGSQVELEDFYSPDARLIFEAVVWSYYADEPVDPVVIGDRLSDPLSRQWKVEASQVPGMLKQQADARRYDDNARDLALVIKRHSTNRHMLSLCDAVKQRIAEGHMTPEEIGDFMTTEAARLTTGTARRAEIVAHADVGREYIKWLRIQKAAREQGIELAVYTGLRFWDSWTKGIVPSELMILGGPPGVGKSAIGWAGVQGFARRQVTKPPDQRIGTLVLSLEMPLFGSAGRVAGAQTRISGDKLREGSVNELELAHIIKAWKAEMDLPLYWNFASNFRMSQMRALVVEAIRRHNVGLLLVDHFRMFDPDRRINNPNQEDEAKARFLKEDIAKDLNVAVLCLAHTVKLSREYSDARPSLNDLRGSGQVAAHCDIVAFMHMPYMFATEEEKDKNLVSPFDAEMIFRKNRNGGLGTSRFEFFAETMTARDI
jgi:replicative DNA helicase